MENVNDDGSNYARVHNINEANLGVDSKLRLLTVCTDVAGNPNTNGYIVDICISPRPDTQAPVIKKYIPESGSYLAFGETKKFVTLKINEPAVCRYATTPNVPYENMKYFCVSQTTGIGPYSCSTEVKNLTDIQNNMYIKCNDSSGNINPTDNLYTLFATREELKIVSWYPENNYIRKTPVNKDNPLYLEVETTGGAYNGISECSYNFIGLGWRDRFFETDNTRHRQEFTSDDAFTERDYNVEVKCNDAAGNEAKIILNFTLEIDRKPPRIINVTNTTIGSEINIQLTSDEEAECYYNNVRCIRDPANQTPIDYGLSITHEMLSISKRLDYYVTCVDQYNNTNDKCAIVINATEKNDRKAPEAVRIYHDSGFYNEGILKLITDKEAICAYSPVNCNFEIDKGISMTSDYSTEHEAEWKSKITYFIRCMDSWGNKNQGCLIIAKPSELTGVSL